MKHPSPDHISNAQVVSKAVLRAAAICNLSQTELACIIGASTATMSRLATGKRMIDLNSKEGELALLFLRLFRGLSTLVGDDDEKIRRWLNAHNTYLDEPPKQAIQRVFGLVATVNYVDAMRGKL